MWGINDATQIVVRTIWREITKWTKTIWSWTFKIPQQLFSLLSLTVACYSIWLVIQSSHEMNKFQNGVIDGIGKMSALSDTLRKNLESLPRDIENFGTAVRELGLVVESQRDSLSKSIQDFGGRLSEFANSLDLYKANLDKLILASDKQIDLLRETQARWASELEKKSDLYLVIENYRIVQDTLEVFLGIQNRGTATAHIIAINLFIPEVLEFVGDEWLRMNTELHMTVFSLTKEMQMTFGDNPNSPVILTNKYLRFRLVRKSGQMFPKKIEYVIYEEQIGLQRGFLTIPPTN